MSPRRSLFAFVLSTCAALGACSSTAGSPSSSDDAGTNDGGTDADALADGAAPTGPKATCAALIACMADVAPEAVGGLVSLYGEASNCWKGTAAEAEACGKACTKTLAGRPECVSTNHEAHLLALCTGQTGARLVLDADLRMSARTGGTLVLSPLPAGSTRYERARALEVWPEVTLVASTSGARGSTGGPFAVSGGAFGGDGRSVRVERLTVEDLRSKGKSFCSNLSFEVSAPLRATLGSSCVYLAVADGAEVPTMDEAQIRACDVP